MWHHSMQNNKVKCSYSLKTDTEAWWFIIASCFYLLQAFGLVKTYWMRRFSRFQFVVTQQNALTMLLICLHLKLSLVTLWFYTGIDLFHVEYHIIPYLSSKCLRKGALKVQQANFLQISLENSRRFNHTFTQQPWGELEFTFTRIIQH